MQCAAGLVQMGCAWSALDTYLDGASGVTERVRARPTTATETQRQANGSARRSRVELDGEHERMRVVVIQQIGPPVARARAMPMAPS